MASPRRVASALKSLSPRPLRTTAQKRDYLAPETPIKNSYKKSAGDNTLSPFSVDTPNRVRILQHGLSSPGKCHSVLGKGGFGTVYKACYKGDEVAAKLVPTRRDGEAIINSEKHGALLKHANIVRILTIEQGASFSLITMELCGTTLQDRLEESELAIGERCFLLRDLASALQFCHNAGVVHADVKPKNILLAADGRPKLTDFGSSVLIGEELQTIQCYGTPGYVAPEVLKGNTPTPKADIYSLGVVAWQMLSRQMPFAGLHAHTIIYLSAKGEHPPDEELKDGLCGRYKELYRIMWSQCPRLRPAASKTIDIVDTLVGQ